MTGSPKPASFEDFLRWLGEPERDTQVHQPEPTPEVLVAAKAAWQEFQSLQRAQREALAARIRAGTYVEELELLAAADVDRNRWLPRLRTPNGFAISALYAPNSPPGAAPVGLLVECPVELIDLCRGQQVHVAAGGQWIELGEIDVDGKAMGDLPAGFEFKPPFGFRVGKWAEQPTELPKPPEPE
jgi:hypothetical protein